MYADADGAVGGALCIVATDVDGGAVRGVARGAGPGLAGAEDVDGIGANWGAEQTTEDTEAGSRFLVTGRSRGVAAADPPKKFPKKALARVRVPMPLPMAPTSTLKVAFRGRRPS